jgi:hypothetical protein
MSTTHTSELTAAEAGEPEAAARAVLDETWLGASTVPSRSLYPHQWSWDAAFVAIGRSWYDQQRAQIELETLFNAQWVNGMLPHIVFNRAVPPRGCFPGPDFWQSHRARGQPQGVATSGITQLPLHARPRWRSIGTPHRRFDVLHADPPTGPPTPPTTASSISW